MNWVKQYNLYKQFETEIQKLKPEDVKVKSGGYEDKYNIGELGLELDVSSGLGHDGGYKVKFDKSSKLIKGASKDYQNSGILAKKIAYLVLSLEGKKYRKQ